MGSLKTAQLRQAGGQPLWPLSRDQWILLLAAVNELALGVETYLAHSISGTIRPNEWIPIVFGLVAGTLLLLAGLVARRNRPVAALAGTVVFVASIVVGILGGYYHLVRGILPTGPPGERISLGMLVWGPPLLAPLMFALMGAIGLSAAWQEEPRGSGLLVLLGDRRLHMPFSKTRAYFFLVSLSSLVTLVSSVLDHARTGYENPWLWVPTAVGVFATVAAAAVGILERPTTTDIWTYGTAMVLMLITGPLGAYLHIQADIPLAGELVAERFIRGAPFVAPMLFANVGLFGLLVLIGEKGTLRAGDQEDANTRLEPAEVHS